MINILSVDNMRKSDAHTIETIVPSKELMRRAGEKIYQSLAWKGPVAVVCGSGNNAGDGFVLAGLLKDNGIECTVFLIKEKFSGDGKLFYDSLSSKDIDVVICTETTCFDGYATIVDCIFGTGFHGEPAGLVKTVIEAINSSKAYVVSVDINSGLNGDSGMAVTCVASDVTVSVGGFKPGHFLSMARDKMKAKVNCDIGIEPVDKPYYLLEDTDVAAMFSKRAHFSNKGDFGYTALIGGSLKYSGAIRLAYMANAAMRSGAGVVKTAAPKEICREIIPHILESTLFPLSCNEEAEVVFVKEEIDALVSNVRTVAFGMGIGVSGESCAILEYLLDNWDGTLIVDADGLTCLSKLPEDRQANSKCRLVLTPHVKEFSRLLHCRTCDIFEKPIELVKDYAKRTGSVVLLKGPGTIVSDGNNVYISDTGCPGMATAGSGDVLSGILAALCANSDDLTMSVAAGAYINGRAGEYAQRMYGQVGMTAGDTVNSIALVIKDMME